MRRRTKLLAVMVLTTAGLGTIPGAAEASPPTVPSQAHAAGTVSWQVGPSSHGSWSTGPYMFVGTFTSGTQVFVGEVDAPAVDASRDHGGGLVFGPLPITSRILGALFGECEGFDITFADPPGVGDIAQGYVADLVAGSQILRCQFRIKGGDVGPLAMTLAGPVTNNPQSALHTRVPWTTTYTRVFAG